jgi:hypothetical protein
MRGRRRQEIIAGRVNADGSIAAGDGFTVIKGATGFYTINFPSSFRLLGLMATAYSNGFTVGQNNTPGMIAINVGTTGVAADSAFSFVAVGIQQ